MSMTTDGLKAALIAAIDPAIAAVDKDPESNPEMGEEIKEALWGAVAEAIVAYLKSNADVVDSDGAPTGKGLN